MPDNRFQHNGLLLVNKPKGVTSHDVIDRLRRIFKQKRIGHTGTLDPMATGLLLICLGNATKASQFLTGHDKRYLATLQLGQTSNTYDAEGTITETEFSNPKSLNFDHIDSELDQFRGEITQQVPAFSAIKIDGKRLYERARNNESIDLPIRKVTIKNLKLISYKYPELIIDVECGSGTYIRSLANDIGRQLKCGAYLKELKRTSIHNLSLDSAYTILQIEEINKENKISEIILPVQDGLGFSSIVISDNYETAVRQGKTLFADYIYEIDGSFKKGAFVSLKNRSGTLLAVGIPGFDSQHLLTAATDSSKLFEYRRVFTL